MKSLSIFAMILLVLSLACGCGKKKEPEKDIDAALNDALNQFSAEEKAAIKEAIDQSSMAEQTMLKAAEAMEKAGMVEDGTVERFNNKKDWARAKACTANMRTLDGALEMYCMEIGYPEEKDFSDFSFLKDYLLEGKTPACPSGGTYSIYKDENDYYKLKCSKHGTMDDLIKKVKNMPH